MGRIRSLWLFLGLVLFAVSFYDVTADVIPSENECRPYIEKAIHELKNTEPIATDNDSTEDKTVEDDASIETVTTSEAAAVDSSDDEKSGEEAATDDQKSTEEGTDDNKSTEAEDDGKDSKEDDDQKSGEQEAETDQKSTEDDDNKSGEENDDGKDSKEQDLENDSNEEKSDNENDTTEQTDDADSKEVATDNDKDSKEDTTADDKDSKEDAADNDSKEENTDDNDTKEVQADDGNDSKENEADIQTNEQDDESTEEAQKAESVEETENVAAEDGDSNEDNENKSAEEAAQTEEDTKEQEATDDNEDSAEEKVRSKRSITDEATPEDDGNDTNEDTAEDNKSQENTDDDNDTKEDTADDNQSQENTEEDNDTKEDTVDDNDTKEDTADDNDTKEDTAEANDTKEESSQEGADVDSNEETPEAENEDNDAAEEDLTLGYEIPTNLRPRSHITQLLGLDAESSIKENALKRTGDVVLKELKKIYDNAIKPLETMYKYRELSNRHYGDPEIFSKPLIVFMGPYSGGKSTILNYLTDNEYRETSIRSGAEPSPAYFNILMHGDEPEVLDGTQLAADWTFSGLQKFGQGLMDRLRGQKLPSKLLERVNIVEIPGILEVRKQVSRYFPFNDACQWFIDRADIIFLVYDPAKLDVGPETEAILDQLKGREYQTRILLNKGDQVKPEELLRVQGALIWNISPLMSSAQPPVMYTVSLWSNPYEHGAPVRLLQAQERAMLTDLREAVDKRIENKIASARRFAVRIRNHAKMVDCYLTTYYNQKSLFSNKKQVSDKIIEHPQNYNIYEGLSTLTNISRYDLPDPEVYLEFFRLNPLYEFKKLSETCTYFKGCPINKLDIAIAYDLPELVGKYKKLLEENYSKLRKEFDENCNQTTTEPPVKLNSR
ncbi:unnamed protein product [Chironomus riparius]|uniref:EH domain-containing protein n=1 Tax=Chironomus riparius TaxID=315576 RepID=A0A9P0J3V7_9DIPT|nr:unnamed protein product [Chironomus riparius]